MNRDYAYARNGSFQWCMSNKLPTFVSSHRKNKQKNIRVAKYSQPTYMTIDYMLHANSHAALTLWRLWLRLHCELCIFQFSESPHSLNAVSAHSQWSRQRAKIFQRGEKFFYPQRSLYGVALESSWVRSEFAMKLTETALRLQCKPRKTAWNSDECTETALRIISSITEMAKLIVL